MSIGCIKNTNDLQNKRKEYAEYLQLMIDNESIKEKRIKDYKNPNKPPAVPPQYKTVAEQNKDLQLQERQAIDNVKELGLDISEARSFVIQLEQKQDGIDNLVKLNRNFPAFKKLVSERLNPKSLETNAVLNLWEEFSVNLNAITGLNSISTNSTNVYSNASDNYKKIPVQDDINGFEKFVNENLFNKDLISFNDTLQSTIRNSLSTAKNLLLNKETGDKIDDLSPIEISQINKLAENLLSVYKIPTKNDLEAKFLSIGKLYSETNDSNAIEKNDALTKDLVILSRFLSGFSDNTTQKRLTEYNEFINKKIGGLYSTIAKENEPLVITDIEEELPASLFEGKNKSKPKNIKIIIDGGYYKDPNFMPLESYGIDINNKKAVFDFFNGENFNGAKLAKLITDYNKKRTSDKRQRTQTRNKVSGLLDDMISEVEKRNQPIERNTPNQQQKDITIILKNGFLSEVKDYNYYDEFLKAIEDVFFVDEPDVKRKNIINKFLDFLYEDYRETNNIDDFVEGIMSLNTYSEELKNYLLTTLKNLKNDSLIPKTPPPLSSPSQKPIYQDEPYYEEPQPKSTVNMRKIELESQPTLRKQAFLDYGGDARNYPKMSVPEIVDFILKQEAIHKQLGPAFPKQPEQVSKYEIGDNPSSDEKYDYLVSKLNSLTIDDLYERIAEMYKGGSYYGKITVKGADGKPRTESFETDRGTKGNFHFIAKSTFLNKFNTKEDKVFLINAIIQQEFFGADSYEGLKKIVEDRPYYHPERDAKYPKQGFGMRRKGRRGGDLIHIDIGSHIGKNYKEAQGKGLSNPQARRITTGVNSNNNTDFGDSSPQENNNNVFGLGAKRQMKLFEKVKKNYQSNGDQPYIKSRIKIGSGVAVAEKEPTYQEFGKFVIHVPQLRKNILNFKYASGSRPQYLPIVNIDDDTKDLLVSTLETGKMSENQFNKLPQPSKDFLIKAIKGAGLQNQLFKGRDKLYATEEKEDRDRFNILKGEFDAGNDNPNLIKELRGLVIKFIDTRIIPKKQGLEFLRQLN
jgi:hypothetical protein